MGWRERTDGAVQDRRWLGIGEMNAEGIRIAEFALPKM